MNARESMLKSGRPLKRVSYRNLVFNGEHKVLAFHIEQEHLLRSDPRIAFLEFLGIDHCKRVIVGTDLHHDLDGTVVVEVLERVDGRGEMSGLALECDLKIADILESLDSHFLAGFLLFIEPDRLHDTLYNKIDQPYDYDREDQIGKNFLDHLCMCFVYSKFRTKLKI